MDEDRALELATGLERHGVRCRLQQAGPHRYRVAVPIADEREAVWDLHADTLEARVSRAGQLLGFVPVPIGAGTPSSVLIDLIMRQRYEPLFTVGRSGSLADATGTASYGSPAGRSRRRRSRELLLLLAIVTAMLLLYLLDGRH